MNWNGLRFAATGGILVICSLWGFTGCKQKSETAGEAAPPVVAPEGPYPKVVVDDLTYNFGAMELNEEGEHVFTIRNEGDADLVLEKGQASCKCTLFEVDRTEIPPGEEAHATVRWKVKDAADSFQQFAPLTTNDPENKEIRLTISGKVTKMLVLRPSDRWDLHDIDETTTTVTAGALMSEILDSFEVESIESSSPLLTTELTPMTPEELVSYQAKSGYMVHAKLLPGVPVGELKEKLSIHALTPKPVTIAVDVVGNRSGPIRIFGPHWNQEHSLLTLGTFPASEGFKVTLTLFLKDEDKDLEFLEVNSDVPSIRVSLDPDEKFKGKSKRYLLTFQIPPSSTPEVRNSSMPAYITVKTNHPEVETIRFRLHFAAI